MENFVIGSVSVDSDSGSISSIDGRNIRIFLDADCCSSSYFEDFSSAELQGLVGEILTKIEHVESRMNDIDDDANGSTVIRYHGLKLTTNKQEIVVDWRNESNGYYDGTCKISGQFEGIYKNER